MTARSKSILLLTATLLIGMVLGALLHARVSEDRIERIAALRTQHGFLRYMEDVVEPESDEQREAIRSILQDASRRMQEHFSTSRTEMRVIMDSTRRQLEGVLTDEQMDAIEQHLGGRHRGPFGPRRGQDRLRREGHGPRGGTP